jgi:hypothetical protein
LVCWFRFISTKHVWWGVICESHEGNAHVRI